MRSLGFRAPERTPTSENVRLGEFGVATFFNNEVITAAPSDAFSYCLDELQGPFVFRFAGLPEPLPMLALPETHRLAPQATYELGLAWDFPFLLRLEYEVSLAGSATAFDVSVPFGLAGLDGAYYGSPLWTLSEFPLAAALTQCTRFCDHPTFDTAGVYNVKNAFRDVYGNLCYRPRYPRVTDGGFPRDP
jgi:hypothetical protein